MKINKLKNAWLLAAVTMLLSACGGPEASQSASFKSGCWSLSDTLSLEFDNTDTEVQRKISIPVSLNSDYKYSNIYVRFALRSPSGKESTMDYQFQLTDATGAWLGESSGDQVDFNMNIGDPFRLTEKGKYRFRVYHYMRDNQLCGITSAGLELKRVD